MIRRGDDDGVDVFSLQYLVVVARGQDRALGYFLGVGVVAVIDVGGDHRSHSGYRLEALQQVRAADSHADEAEADLIVLRGCLQLRAGTGQLVDDGSGSRALQKISSRSHDYPSSAPGAPTVHW